MAKIIAYKARWQRLERVLKEAIAEPEGAEEEDFAVNITPFFSRAIQATGTSDDYWFNLGTGYLTQGKDGWAKLTYENTGTSIRDICIYPRAQEHIKNSTQYTLLLELDDIDITGDITFRPSNAATQHPQMHGAAWKYDGSTSYRWTMTSYADAETNSQTLVRFLISVAAGTTASFDIRLSLYEGDYQGEYVPYLEGRA